MKGECYESNKIIIQNTNFSENSPCCFSDVLEVDYRKWRSRRSPRPWQMGSQIFLCFPSSSKMSYISFFEKHFWVFSSWTKLRLLTLGPIWFTLAGALFKCYTSLSLKNTFGCFFLSEQSWGFWLWVQYGFILAGAALFRDLQYWHWKSLARFRNLKKEKFNFPDFWDAILLK